MFISNRTAQGSTHGSKTIAATSHSTKRCSVSARVNGKSNRGNQSTQSHGELSWRGICAALTISIPNSGEPKSNQTLGQELATFFNPPYPEDYPVIVPSGDEQSSVNGEQWTVNSEQLAETFPLSPLPTIGSAPHNGFALGDGAFVGSNNWVVAGEHTTTGMPLLANDPHLGVQMPSIWFWNGLHAPGWNVAGMSFAGVPGVIIGHNEHIAWGVTTMGWDTQDTYIEKINPANQLQYEFEGEWRNMTVIKEEIKVNGGETIMLEVRETIHGPLLNTIDEELEEVLSMRWTAAEPTRLFASVIQLNQAENYEQFHKALALWDTSGQNIVYADVEGNIAYQSTARFPIRNGWTGDRPVPGWTGEFEWDGFVPYEEMPRLLNPARGFIVTANNAIVDDGFPYSMRNSAPSGERAERIENLLEDAIAQGGVSAETLQQIQNDSYDLQIDHFQPLFRGLSSDDALTQEAYERLRGWDGQLDADSVPATIFEAFLWQLSEQIFGDELGEAGRDLLIRHSGDLRIVLSEMAADADNPLWDDVMTSSAETQQQIIERAVEATVAYLRDEFGNNSDNWQWGDVHIITFRSNPLGESGIAPLERLVNRGPFPVSGGRSSPNANSFGWGDNFAQVRSNPSMRMIVDLSDFDASLAIHPTGQSGHPFHKHYDDMIPLWLNGELHPFAFSTAKVDELTTETLTLEPR